MNKTTIGVIVTAVALVVVGVVLIANSGQEAPVATGDTSSTQSTDRSSASDASMPAQSNAPAASNTGDAAKATAVSITNFAFAPETIKVKKGTTVTWTNQDTTRHDVMPDKPSDAFKASELLSKGESYSFTFNTVGTYTYYCTPHPHMKGTVEVTE